MLSERFITFLSVVGLLFLGYFLGRVFEAWIIGSWNYPKRDIRFGRRKVNG